MAPHSSALNLETPKDREAWWAVQFMGREESGATEATEHAHASLGGRGSDGPFPQLGQGQWLPCRTDSAGFLVFWQLYSRLL